MYKEISIHTELNECLIDVTEEIRKNVRNSRVNEGVCLVFVPHTTAGVTINSCADKLTLNDIVEETHRIIPTRVDFNHVMDTPTDAAGHVKSVLVGNSLSLIIKEGELALGEFQSILFFEFDGPRSRRLLLRIMHDHD